ncbi:hypothetical protein FEM48_Zijuj09G0076400 [Ziziphus jujuba var. spinosa]|uniref:Myb-like domain-containing protein n=1 Tax=Ziziphus jujuba var. spinosa TaxID=714518 RepID=A0A978URP5_ZIZJJ|nr:hypothetical protein FEM48_Zijuj09G0076400 [Ziziphus jujuba var. spinosa]
MATPPPSASASPSPPAANVTAKKPQPLPWTHQETVHLIQAYQEKWYSLKRGQLKSSQWEEVAVTVAARCGYDYSEPSKTAIQCRHKMEKLRQRYRAEKKQRLGLSGASSSWQYFDLIDSLERGPLPISARPMVPVPYSHGEAQEDEDDDEDEEDNVENHSNKSRSINYILRRPAVVNRFAGEPKLSRGGGGGGGGGNDGNWGFSGSLREPVAKKRKESVDEDYEEVEVEGQRGRELVLKLAGEIRGFADRFIGMENMKMEILKETERCRMEMETKRMDMILQSQHKIVDSIAKAFESSNHQFNMAQQEM